MDVNGECCQKSFLNGVPVPDISGEIDGRETDPLTSNIIGAAIDVHRALGPGLLESPYEACLLYKLRLRRLKVEAQKPLPIFYKDVMLDCGYRLDLIVEDLVIIEIKSVNAIAPIHEAQLLSYRVKKVIAKRLHLLLHSLFSRS